MKSYSYFGKKYYFIKYKGKMVKRFGMFRVKENVRKAIINKIPKWEQDNYSIGTKI